MLIDEVFLSKVRLNLIKFLAICECLKICYPANFACLKLTIEIVKNGMKYVQS